MKLDTYHIYYFVEMKNLVENILISKIIPIDGFTNID